MENNIRKIKKEYIEEVFKKCRLEFDEIDLLDDDINYSISFNASKIVPGIGNLNAIMFFSSDGLKCTFMLGNIYRFNDENIENAFSIANSINRKLNEGKVIIMENPTQLIFLDSRTVDCIEEIDVELIEDILLSAKVAIALIYTEIKGIKNEE